MVRGQPPVNDRPCRKYLISIFGIQDPRRHRLITRIFMLTLINPPTPLPPSRMLNHTHHLLKHSGKIINHRQPICHLGLHSVEPPIRPLYRLLMKRINKLRLSEPSLCNNYERLTNLECSPQLVTMSPQSQPSRDSVNPGYLQTQSHQYPQTTVTPSSLHNAITPASYYSTPSIVPPPTPQKAQVQAQLQPSRPTSAQSGRSTSSSGSISASSTRHPESHLRNLLSANAFESSPAGAARSLINALKTMGISDVSSALRKDILNTMRDNAGKDFFEAWSKSTDGMETFRIWLKAAVTRKGDGKREADETLMPLLNVCHCQIYVEEMRILLIHALVVIQVIDRLPLGIEELRAAKIGKLVKNIVTDPPSSGEFYIQVDTFPFPFLAHKPAASCSCVTSKYRRESRMEPLVEPRSAEAQRCCSSDELGSIEPCFSIISVGFPVIISSLTKNAPYCALHCCFLESISAAKDLAAILTQKWTKLINQEQKRTEEGAQVFTFNSVCLSCYVLC